MEQSLQPMLGGPHMYQLLELVSKQQQKITESRLLTHYAPFDACLHIIIVSTFCNLQSIQMLLRLISIYRVKLYPTLKNT